MFDIYIFITIFNVLWYLLSILYVLYKYTTFFKTVFNFFIFLKKTFYNINSICKKTRKFIYNTRRLETNIDLEMQRRDLLLPNLENIQNKTFYSKSMSFIKKWFNYKFYISNSSNRESDYLDQERILFNNHINNLEDSEDDM